MPDRVDHDVNKLTEGCHVLDVLDKSIKEDLIRWFVNLQLRDYRDLFNPTKVGVGGGWNNRFPCRCCSCLYVFFSLGRVLDRQDRPPLRVAQGRICVSCAAAFFSFYSASIRLPCSARS